MASVYFDSSVFLAIFNGESVGSEIHALLKELKKDSSRIYTSIITVQEVSVLSFRIGLPVADNHSKVAQMCRIYGVTKEIALTAAKIEAHIIDRAKGGNAQEPTSQRRKWDCFHIATAMNVNCSVLYTLDEGMLTCESLVKGSGLTFSTPRPKSPPLFPDIMRLPVQ